MKLTAILILLLGACGDKDGAATNGGDAPSDTGSAERGTLENVGVACIDGNDEDDNQNTARVKVILSECLESCAMDPRPVKPPDATVTDRQRVTDLSAREDCRHGIIMEAECPADGVAKGNFALEYAGNSVDFSGPVSSAVCTTD